MSLKSLYRCEYTVRGVFRTSQPETFKLGEFEYCELFQEIQDANALMLDMEDGALEIHGILSSQFFMKYRACFSYDTMEMFFTAPNNSN